MGKCKHSTVCGLEDASQPDDYLCILHSNDPDKNRHAFETALNVHRQTKKRTTNFSHMVFPYEIDFTATRFSERADFEYAQFTQGVRFDKAVFVTGASFARCEFLGDTSFMETMLAETAWFNKTHFKGEANFWGAKFSRANFSGAKFEKNSDFGSTTFSDNALFHLTEFRGEAHFTDATFNGSVVFSDMIFSESTLFTLTRFEAPVMFSSVIFKGLADFEGCVFTKDGEFRETDFFDVANFRDSKFFGSISFTATGASPVFHGAATFEYASCSSGDSLRLIGTDLRRCKFLGAEVRKFYFIGVNWPRIGRFGGRHGVFDEIAPNDTGDQRRWALIEDLYRQLKQNYEDRRDYERAGGFHIGEKEMRLRNPRTPLGLRFLLAIYKGISGYGEKCGRPVFWLLVLLLMTSSAAVIYELTLEIGRSRLALSPQKLGDWGWAILYGIETMVHLPAKGFAASGYGRVISTFASILGPVLIALFGFALRQRLKR